ncbi:MAG TPA: hypothetical protein VJ925_02795 [Longimicrobiales bacterium]|nr:hypothetical protein [Longimicrobiales bacterium]
MATSTDTAKPRIRAHLALAILEVLQAQDTPVEVLEDENPSQTMPRRLGLSGVVDRQVQLYRAEARRGGRITDGQFHDLVQLVTRRPDAPEIFWQVGRRMADAGDQTLVSRLLPEPLRYARLRRRVRRRIRKVFGRVIGGFAPGPFSMEGRDLLFTRHAPAGEACYLASGLCQSLVEEGLGAAYHVVHDRCEARGDALCRWTITGDATVRESSRAGDWMPEPEAS